MRDRLAEFLPLLLAGVVVLVFQLARPGGPVFPFQLLSGLVGTPTPEAASRSASPALQLTPVPALNKQSVGLCSPAHPQFVGGMISLKAALGAAMGEPSECERSVDDVGDTEQKTTTGLAYYRKQTNVVCFTTGWDHWALAPGELLHWTGDAVDPPADAGHIRR